MYLEKNTNICQRQAACIIVSIMDKKEGQEILFYIFLPEIEGQKLSSFMYSGGQTKWCNDPLWP